MGTSKTAPNDWMKNDGTGKTEPYATSRGWCITHPNGVEEVLHCMKGCLEAVPNPAGIMIVRNPVEQEYALGEYIEFKVTWDEPVNITVAGGIPSIDFEVGGVAKSAALIGGAKTGATRSTFRFVADADTGDVDTVTTTVALNGGTILSADDGVTPTTLTFPADYNQPTNTSVV